MNLSSILAFLGEHKISLCLKQGRVHFRSPVIIPSPVLKSMRERRYLFVKALKRYENREVIVSPLSYNQQSLWFSYLLSPDSKSYNVAVPMRIFSPTDFPKIKKILESLLAYHDQLRATFDTVSDDLSSVPCQFIPFVQDMDLRITDVSGMTDNRIRELVQEFYSTPFSLSDSPAFRAAVFSRGDSGHILVFLFHHIICDAHSLKIFMDNFSSLYCKNNGTLPQAASYIDFVYDQAKYLKKYQETLAGYWRARSDCARGLSLVTDLNRRAVKSHNGKTVYFRIDGETVHQVSQLSRLLSITQFSFYFGCFQLLYMLRSGSLDATTGILSSGRSNSQFINTMGYFVNPLPVFCNRLENHKLADHLRWSHKDICELLDNQNYPFSLLVENISAERSVGRPVLFSAIFNMLSKRQLGPASSLVYSDENGADMILGEMAIKPYSLDQQEGQFDITLELLERDDSIKGILKYDPDLFSTATAGELASLYNDIIKEVIGSSDDSIGNLFTRHNKKTDMVANHRWHISVAATFTANILQESFQFWESFTGVAISYDFSPYYQLEQYLQDPSMHLSRQTGYIFLLLRLEDLTYQDEFGLESNPDYINARASELVNLIIKSAREKNARFVLIFCPPSSAVTAQPGLSRDFARLERSVVSQLNKEQRIFCIGSEYLVQSSGGGTGYEPSTGTVGHVPYTEHFYELLGLTIIRTVYAFEKPPCKAIIVDCDNTLWAGVAGEDPVSRIVVTEPFREFQLFLKKCRESGIPLCLCSKNNSEDIFAIFENHPEMVLKAGDISFHRINWQPKSRNILEIVREANLTTAGIVFIDDNPAECAEVGANCPDVTVIHLPEEPNDRMRYLRNFWAFDTLKVTAEDLSRIEKYKVEKSRSDFRNQVSSFAGFIDGLNLNINIRSAVIEDIPRISQLSYRTNQFTTGTFKLSEKDILETYEHSDLFAVEVSDRFGDYGLVGVIKGGPDGTIYSVDSFFLSCRSLGRGVEHRCLSFIGQHAIDGGFENVKIPVFMTARNKPLVLFLESVLPPCQKGNDSEFVYLVPSEIAARVFFDPEKYALQSSSLDQQSAAVPSASNQFCFPARLLDEIAGKFSSADSLHEQILALRKRKQGSAAVPDKAEAVSSIGRANSEIGQIIQKIWCDSIGKENIGVDQNFFEAGGSSILLPHIVQKIQQFLNKKVSLVELFQYPTISSLAAYLESRAEEAERCDMFKESST